MLCSDSLLDLLVGLFRYPSGRKSHGKIHVVAHADVLEPPKGLMSNTFNTGVLSNMPFSFLFDVRYKSGHCLVKSESIKGFKIGKVLRDKIERTHTAE